jgi:hypothetical protein
MAFSIFALVRLSIRITIFVAIFQLSIAFLHFLISLIPHSIPFSESISIRIVNSIKSLFSFIGRHFWTGSDFVSHIAAVMTDDRALLSDSEGFESRQIEARMNVFAVRTKRTKTA